MRTNYPPEDRSRLLAAYAVARDALLTERNAEGFWVGELSSSALATATAVIALHFADSTTHSVLIRDGLNWLVATRNPDGGWGDTIKSFSNISTSMLVRAAFAVTGSEPDYAAAVEKLEGYLTAKCGSTPAERAEAIRNRYGKDRTFSVPILMTCALAGLVPWQEVPRLPFELACLPQSWYRFAGLPVVSYALPALIAIGQCVHANRPTWNPVTGPVRWLARNRSLKVLRRIQPSSGGYLEATPLTSFVVMGLLGSYSPLPLRERGGGEGSALPAATRPPRTPFSPLRERGGGEGSAPSPGKPLPLTPNPSPSRGEGDKILPSARQVVDDAVRFLVASARPDGSWPIDTNLSIWVTTLAVNALAVADDLGALPEKEKTLAWLLAQQTKERHPYTGAAPGGWGWSHCPGSVPDCDDTPGAVLAACWLETRIMSEFQDPESEVELGKADLKFEKRIRSILAAERWLLSLQNRDCGWPTFCRGWGKLHFDRSGSDLTAHALRAVWRTNQSLRGCTVEHPGVVVWRYEERGHWSNVNRLHSGMTFLTRSQRPDGSWLPLWFGNQHAPDDENPVYGSARVLAAYRDLGLKGSPECQRGVNYLLSVQNPDGGWGGAKGCPPSVEETALAVEVLIDLAPGDAVQRGLARLVEAVESGQFRDPSPIGFYFAKLWYFEKLYPLVFTVAALGRATRTLRQSGKTA
jgi:squalene-hopene/tetraprenyl-beta-curcumene cyclase